MSVPVIVTGGAGYIGSHTAKALACAGYIPVTIDNFTAGHRWAVAHGPLEQGDITDRPFLDRVFEKHHPAAILHFAAHIAVGESVHDPGKYYRNNVAGTLTLLEEARDHDISAFVFSSTAAVYGTPQTVPIPVDHPLSPINPYGWSKRMMEQILDDFDHAHNIRYAALRYFNAAGADPDGGLGEAHNPETHLIPLVILAAMGIRPEITLFGTDYPTPDGTAIRDYIHVTDLAEAHVLALTRLLNGADSFTVNMGTGQGHSVREVIRAVEQVGDRPVPVVETARRPGDAPVLVADGSRAMDLLGWQPSFTDLTAIVETAWQWHASHR